MLNGVVVSSYGDVPSNQNSARTSAINVANQAPVQADSVYLAMAPPSAGGGSSSGGDDQRYGQLNLIVR
jgi:hypothetical protein